LSFFAVNFLQNRPPGKEAFAYRGRDAALRHAVFSAAKLFFSYGLGNAMAFALSVGATTVLLPQRPTPEAVFETMRRHRPTIFYGVPTLYASLLAHKDIRRGAGSDRLRLCISAGEPLPRARSPLRPGSHFRRQA
jgi:acyl-coenzyme A synthetase/AMP-(fatty) acid ligase